MHRKMRKFNLGKDTSPLKEDDNLVMDYATGDMMLETKSRRSVGSDFDFEEITRQEPRVRQNDDIDEWLSGKRNLERPSRVSPYVNNQKLYESSIDNLSIEYGNNEEQAAKPAYKTGIEQLAKIRKETEPAKPFISKTEEVRYRFSEKNRQEEIRKFTRQRQQENRIKRQKDEDRKRTEELKKMFDLEDGDDYTDSSIEEELESIRKSVGGKNHKSPNNTTVNKTSESTRNIKPTFEDSEEDDDDQDFINVGDGFDTSKIKSRGSVKTQSHHHSHKRHRTSKAGRVFRTIRNIILIAVAVIIGFVGIGYGAYRLMDYTGGLSLYNRTQDQAPDMSQARLYESVTIEDDQMPLTASAWQPGWIRYDGITYAYNSNLLTFLVLGIDSMDKVHKGEDGISGGQSDAMFFLVLDPDNKEIKIIAINRNTMTDIDVYNEEGVYVGTGEAQICLQHGFGDGLTQSCTRTVKTVRNLFHELPINGYISINMGAIPTVNNTVGGVTLEVMYDLPAYGQYRSLKKGEMVTLTGDDAYWYTQHRDINDDFSANERLERQLQYLIEFIPALQDKVKEDPKSIASVYNALSPYMVTDIGLNEAVYLGNEAAQYSFDSANIYQMKGESIIGRSGFEEFIYDEDGLYDLIIDVFYTEVDA